jgi:hypothetical protein
MAQLCCEVAVPSSVLAGCSRSSKDGVAVRWQQMWQGRLSNGGTKAKQCSSVARQCHQAKE